MAKETSTVHTALRGCCRDFSFAQCSSCRQVFSVRHKGRLPKCDQCGTHTLERVRHIE